MNQLIQNALEEVMNNSDIIVLPVLRRPVNIFERSFQEQPNNEKPLEKKFCSQLEEYTITEEDHLNDLSCAICQDKFKVGESVIKLPCVDIPHFFHKGEKKEECEGIYPWFEANNTCPICRSAFPEEPEPEPEPGPEPGPESEQGPLTPEEVIGLNIDLTQLPFQVNQIVQQVNEERRDENETTQENNEMREHVDTVIMPMFDRMVREMQEMRDEEELQATILRSIEET